MKQFIIEIILIFSMVFIIGELSSRFFELKTQTVDFLTSDNQGFYSNKPNSTGNYVFGKFPNIHKTKFHFNDIGFNTPLDFKDFNEKKITIAFLGDSFVESYNVNYYDSFSSILMNQSEVYQSYDFGVSGYNMEDYIWIYKKYDLEKFDHVFLIPKTNDFTNSGNRIKYNPSKEKYRALLKYFHFLNYLNYNHNIFKTINELFKKKLNRAVKKNEFVLNKNHRKFLSNTNLKILPRDEETYMMLKKEKIKNVIMINHDLKPFDFGQLNRHWNKNGRINVISTIIPYISQENKD